MQLFNADYCLKKILETLKMIPGIELAAKIVKELTVPSKTKRTL